MAESMNRTVEYACKGTSFLGLQNYGKIMVGDKSFEFYDDRNVENYIQIPWEEINYIVADVAFGGKWIPRFEVQTFHNGNYRFSAGKDTKPLLRRNKKMHIVCLDLEGVLVPEIWIAFSEVTGIPELTRTTRDEPDYEKLMAFRRGILHEHGLGLPQIQETIAKIDPLPGALEFLNELRSMTQAVIISDTFTEFAMPLMKKLGWPTLFCNSLIVAPDGEIIGHKMRVENSKYSTVKALQSIGFETIGIGDSYNDLAMIQAGKDGFLFRTTDQIRKDHPELPVFDEYDDLLAAIKKVIGA